MALELDGVLLAVDRLRNRYFDWFHILTMRYQHRNSPNFDSDTCKQLYDVNNVSWLECVHPVLSKTKCVLLLYEFRGLSFSVVRFPKLYTIGKYSKMKQLSNLLEISSSQDERHCSFIRTVAIAIRGLFPFKGHIATERRMR